MTRTLPLYTMAPEASFDRASLTEGMLPNTEITQRIKEVMEPLWDDIGVVLDFVYPMPGHPVMWPEPGYIVFISFPFSCLSFSSFPDPMRLTLRGAGLVEGPHPHGSPGGGAEGFGYEGGESH